MQLRDARSSPPVLTWMRTRESRRKGRVPRRFGSREFAIRWLRRLQEVLRLDLLSFEDSLSGSLAKQVDLGEVDDFIAAPAENRFHHEQAEALRLFQSDRRGHREFLTRDEDLNHGRAVVLQCLRNHGLYLVRSSDRQSQYSGSFGDLREIWTLQVSSKLEETGGLLLQFHKGQCLVLEDDHLHRQVLLFQGNDIPHEHRETTITRERDDLAPGIGSLCSDSLRHCVCHRSMVKGAKKTPFPVHREVACGPNYGRAYVASKNRVVGCEFVDHTRNVLGMNWSFVGISSCKVIQAFACLPIVF